MIKKKHKRQVRVIFEGDGKEEYLKLNEIVGKEKIRGLESSENITLLKSIDQKVELLKLNPQAGRAVEKKLIPKKYIEKYNITNLWIINLANYWRMMYNLQSTEVHILCFILDLGDHDKYNKLFGFKKK